jgi:hypothetical protein
MKVLQAYLQRVSISQGLASINTANHAASVSYDRIAFSMVISLFAVRFRNELQGDILVFITVQATESRKVANTNPAATSPSFRPHTLATLLSLIQSVMHSDCNLMCPIEELDLAQTILVRWGETIPFCWTIWDDQRIAHMQSISHLVIVIICFQR